MKSGEWCSLHGKMKLSWRRAKATASEPTPEWQITGWKSEEMQYSAIKAKNLFEGVDIKDDEVIQFRCGDGFAAPISKERMLTVDESMRETFAITFVV